MTTTIEERRIQTPTPRREVPEIDEVGRAALILDELKPGWAPKIDTGRLNLASLGGCVLGQLYDDFGRGFERFKNYDHTGRLAMSGVFASNEYLYRWREEIAART